MTSMTLCVVTLAMLLSVAIAAPLSSCNATSPLVNNETVSLQYLENFGNVSFSLDNTTRIAQVSFCVPANVSVNGENCGPSYLSLLQSTCAESILFTDIVTDLAVMTNTSSGMVLKTSNGLKFAHVYLYCQAGLSGLQTPNVTQAGADYSFSFVSETVCAGYVDDNSSSGGGDNKMMSKGAIVGIIIGIVAVVVIAAAIFQWRSKASSEEYQRI